MTKDCFNEFIDLLHGFRHVMLVTHAPRGLRAEATDNGRLWFITNVDSDLIGEITEKPEVLACLQDGQRFLTVSGTARATRDPERIRELWSENQRVWFEKGRDDPSLILLEIVPSHAEYWNRSGVEGVKFLLAELAALIGGQTLTGDEARHGRLDFGKRSKRPPG